MGSLVLEISRSKPSIIVTRNTIFYHNIATDVNKSFDVTRCKYITNAQCNSREPLQNALFPYYTHSWQA